MQNVILGRKRNDEILMDITKSLFNTVKLQKELGLSSVDWRKEWLAEIIKNKEMYDNGFNDNCNYLNDKYLICNAFRKRK